MKLSRANLYIALSLVFLLLSSIITMPVPASTLPTEPITLLPSPELSSISQPQGSQGSEATLAATQPLTATSFVLLPMVVHNQRSRPACSQHSPFSLQIAALHQVEPGGNGTHTIQALNEAEWWVLYEESFPSLMEALKASGACWARLRVDWALIQPDPPPAPYIWGPYHDEKLRLVAETGVQLIVHVDGIPDWAGDAPEGPIDPTRLDAFRQFLIDLVDRYKEPPWNVHHWELFNEPDRTVPAGGSLRLDSGQALGWGHNGGQYAQMLEVAYAAIKAADPEATVLMGGVAYDWFLENGGPFYRYFLDDVMASGGAEHLDTLNFHYFPDFHHEWERWDPSSEERLTGWLPAPTCGDLFDGQGAVYEAGGIDLIAKANHFRNRLQTCFGVDKPIWLTELGEHGRAGAPNSLAQQARYVIQGYVRGLAAGIQNITWFTLVSPPYDPYEQGLLYEDDWSPKPAYYTYQTLTRELAGYAYSYTLEVPDVEGYVFRDDHGQEKTVAWGSGRVTFAPASLLRIVDREGNVTIVEDGGERDADRTQNGAVQLQITADPIFVSR
ncbi:hypothetical protein ACFLYD_00230 [Chloroflexota bacterium]